MNTPLSYYVLMISFPFLGLLLNAIVFKKNSELGSLFSTIGVGLGFTVAIACLMIKVPLTQDIAYYGFKTNELTWLIACLILFVSGVVHAFSIKFMAGDRFYGRYFLNLTLLTLFTLLMVAADNVLILSLFWSLSNLTLVSLMIHKFQWKAAKNSGILALKTFALGSTFLLSGSLILSKIYGTYSLYEMTLIPEFIYGPYGTLALILIMLAAFTQSGIWPFHRWLTSSLNSPTPVSALMHAGLVNGGGLLLARFAPLFLANTMILNLLFFFGILSLTLGTLWKLIQSDVKRMLACSTMGQMGFMIMQCGLGLFSAAVAHLIWHGLFKAFLFLRSGSTLQENRRSSDQRTSTVPTFIAAIFCGFIGAYGFALASNLPFITYQTPFILIVFAGMATTQLAHTLLEKSASVLQFCAAFTLSFCAGVVYGLSVYLIEQKLSSFTLFVPQNLNVGHSLAVSMIVLIWITMNLKPLLGWENTLWWRRGYVYLLNGSQRHEKTVTSIRKEYEF